MTEADDAGAAQTGIGLQGKTSARQSAAPRDAPLIVVYTMGKVASTSVSKSLRARNIPCYDIHNLARDRFLSVLDAHIANKDLVSNPKHMIEALHVMQALKSGRRVRLISLIREPAGRNIAAVFQNLPIRLREDEEAILQRLRSYPVSLPDSWFAEDFIPSTGIDVFSIRHDSTADHFRFEHGPFSILLMKMEADDARKAELVSEFLGLPITIERANEAKDKWYRELYLKFASDRRVLSDEFLEKCFSLKYFQAFYSEVERRRVAERYMYGGPI
jgi:hypothetical protein